MWYLGCNRCFFSMEINYFENPRRIYHGCCANYLLHLFIPMILIRIISSLRCCLVLADSKRLKTLTLSLILEQTSDQLPKNTRSSCGCFLVPWCRINYCETLTPSLFLLEVFTRSHMQPDFTSDHFWQFTGSKSRPEKLKPKDVLEHEEQRRSWTRFTPKKHKKVWIWSWSCRNVGLRQFLSLRRGHGCDEIHVRQKTFWLTDVKKADTLMKWRSGGEKRDRKQQKHSLFPF